MEQLPTDVITHMLAHMSAAESSSVQNSMLTVSKVSQLRTKLPAWAEIPQSDYLTVLPILYRSARITSRLAAHSFLLGATPIDVPSGVEELSTAELLSAGHYKLAALRYVQHIYVDLDALRAGYRVDGSYAAVDGPGLTSNQFLSALEALPREVLPSLETVSVAQRELGKRLRYEDVGLACYSDLGQERVVTRLWQQIPLGPVRLSSSSTPMAHFPSALRIWHVHALQTFAIIPGGTTEIHVPPGSPRSRSSHLPFNWDHVVFDDPPKEADLGLWVGAQVCSALLKAQLQIDQGGEQRQAVIDRTRVVIVGLFPYSTRCDPQERREAEHVFAQTVVAAAKSFLSRVTTAMTDLTRVRIELRKADKAHRCQACGDHGAAQ